MIAVLSFRSGQNQKNFAAQQEIDLRTSFSRCFMFFSLFLLVMRTWTFVLPFTRASIPKMPSNTEINTAMLSPSSADTFTNLRRLAAH